MRSFVRLPNSGLSAQPTPRPLHPTHRHTDTKTHRHNRQANTHTHTQTHTRAQRTAHNLQRLGEERAADDRGEQDAASPLYSRHIHWRDNGHCLILRQLIQRIGSTREDN
jgi:hypothetical protein